MIYYFSDPIQNIKHEFWLSDNHPGYVKIVTYNEYSLGGQEWLHMIKNGKIIWRNDDFMRLSKEAKQYIQRIVGLIVFE